MLCLPQKVPKSKILMVAVNMLKRVFLKINAWISKESPISTKNLNGSHVLPKKSLFPSKISMVVMNAFPQESHFNLKLNMVWLSFLISFQWNIIPPKENPIQSKTLLMHVFQSPKSVLWQLYHFPKSPLNIKIFKVWINSPSISPMSSI